MNQLNFFTPIKGNAIDEYFRFGEDVAEISSQQFNERFKEVNLVKESTSVAFTILKVISYITLILPIIFLIAKAIQRSQIQYYFIDKLVKEAAVKQLQNAARRYISKAHTENLKNKTVLLGSVCKGHIERNRVKNRLANIVTVQNAIRGCNERVRKERKIEKANFKLNIEKAKHWMDNPDSLSELPKAENGKTSGVYFPLEYPIVIKKIDEKTDKDRVKRTNLARKMCKTEHYKNITVPRVSQYKNDFIIEEKLPISKSTYKSQMGLYISHRELFTDAVVEFTQFYLKNKGRFLDLLSHNEEQFPCSISEGISIARYDNIPFYIKDGKGYIGFVDLEQFSPDSLSTDNIDLTIIGRLIKGTSLDAFVSELIELFPYHLETILGEAKKFDEKIVEYKDKFAKQKQKHLAWFDKFYIKHSDFLKSKSISEKNPFDLLRPNNEKMNKICESVCKSLSEKHLPLNQEELSEKIKSEMERNKIEWGQQWIITSMEEKEKKKLFSSNEIINSFKDTLPKIVEEVYSILENGLLEKKKKTEISSIKPHEVAELRTVQFEKPDIISKYLTMLEKKDYFYLSSLEYDVFKYILETLIKEGEISHYYLSQNRICF